MKHVLNLIGLAALVWAVSEPAGRLDWRWFAGEAAAIAIMILAFWAASIIEKHSKNTR